MERRPKIPRPLIVRANRIIRDQGFKDFLETLAKNHIHHDDESAKTLALAIAYADQTEDERQLKGNSIIAEEAHFADPLTLATSLAEYSNTDSPSIIASLLYSSLRRSHGNRPDARSYFEVEDLFGKEVRAIVEEALEMAYTSLPGDIRRQITSNEAEEALFAPFLERVIKKVHDERSLLIRMTEWDLFLQSLDAKSADPAKRPSALDVSKTKNFYVSMAETFFLRLTRSRLADQWLRLAHPDEFQEIETQIKAARQILEARKAAGEPIEGEIFKALGEGWESKCEIEARIKSAASIYENREKRRKAGDTRPEDLSDIIGFRLIIDAGSPENEVAAVRVVHEALRAYFKSVPGRQKEWLEIPKQPTGYRALHNTFYFNGDDRNKFEVHVVGRAMYAFNEGDPRADHRAYKRKAPLSLSARFRKAAEEVGVRKVTIFTKDNLSVEPLFRSQTREYPESHRYRLSFGSTAADILQYLKDRRIDAVFEVENIEIERGSSFRQYNPKIPPFRQFLASSDELQITINPELLHNREHREKIIAAVSNLAFKRKLAKRHNRLLAREQRPQRSWLPKISFSRTRPKSEHHAGPG